MVLSRWIAAVMLAAGAMVPAVVAQTPTTELTEIQVVGGSTITKDTVEYYLEVSEGDAYDAAALTKGFRKLWESGLVEDLKLESEEIAPGKVRLIVTLRERPKVSEFVFKGNKKVTTSTLREKLDTAGVSLKKNVPLRDSELQRLRQGITDVYAKEGYASAAVTAKVEEVNQVQRKVTFQIDEGAKVRIGKISFDGNKVYPDWRLRWALKKIKSRSLIRPWGKKLIWDKENWGEDSENVKKFYMNRGYKDVVVGEPKVEMVARHPQATTQKKKRFRMLVRIPVEEGNRFRMGSLSLKGVSVLKADALTKLYETKPGKVYKYNRVEQGSEAVRNLYNGLGYIHAYTDQDLKARKDEPDVVDVVVNVFEGERYRLGRLEFAGNTKTQDKVLRREFRLAEGDWMNLTVFRRSVFKVNQLGYFKLKEDPLKLDFDQEKKTVNVIVKGEEVGRTDIQFGAGYSELDRLFAQFMFNTRNFMGRGETLGVSAQVGRTGNLYSLSFSEPYFLDRRQSIGASIYKQKIDLGDYYSESQQYLRESKGGTIFWGAGLGDFDQFSLVYGFEDVYAEYNTVRGFPAGQGPVIPRRRPLPTPSDDLADDKLYIQKYSGITSSFTPSYGYDSRDDPFDPSRGLSLFSRLRFAGGFLGGDFYYWRPEIGVAWFKPIRRRFIFAANFEGGLIKPFSGREIPVYDRYRMGGERSLRGIQYLSVLPRTKDGDYFTDAYGVEVGGDRYVQLNLEYQIKLGGPLKFIFFSDAGNTWHEKQGWELSLMRYTAGAELRVFLPIFQAPLRFIYGINLKPFKGEDKSDFQFSIGTTF
jgi:outer membrane protein insertion porin family